MARGLRILFVSLAVPVPPTNGHRMRNWMLLRAMAEEGHEVTMVSFAEPHELSDGGPGVEGICRSVELVPLPEAGLAGARMYWNRLQGLISPLPYGVWRFRSEAMQAAVQKWLTREPFDIVICDDIYNVKNLPPAMTVPVVLNKHDITSVIVRRFLQQEPNPLKRVYGWIEYKKLRRWEARVCSSVSSIWVCSDCDKAVLEGRCPAAGFTVVPNVIDAEHYTSIRKEDGLTVLYVGSMDWYPNQDAVDFFVFRILPRLRERVPGVRFVVAGRGPSEKFQRRFDGLRDVSFTGMVPDMRYEIAKAALSVVPLRIGSGTRLKILEAGAMERAIVSTRLGAEGLEFIDGKEIILEDEAVKFAHAVSELLTDKARRHALGMAARHRVEQQYALPALKAAIRKAFEGLEKQ